MIGSILTMEVRKWQIVFGLIEQPSQNDSIGG